MMEKDSFLGSLLVLPVELCKGIAGSNNNQIDIYRGTYSFANWLFGCSAWGTEPNNAQQVWYVGIQEEYYLECFRSYDIYKQTK